MRRETRRVTRGGKLSEKGQKGEWLVQSVQPIIRGSKGRPSLSSVVSSSDAFMRAINTMIRLLTESK